MLRLRDARPLRHSARPLVRVQPARTRLTAPAAAPSQAVVDNVGALYSTEPSYESMSSMDDPEFRQHVVPWTPRQRPRVRAPADAPPIVILPGFGNCASDYTEALGNKQASITTALEARGFKVYVLPIERKNWFQVAKAIFTTGFWSASLTTHPGYTWYLDLVDATVKQALAETGAKQVDLVCHSAGGWLGRAYIGDPAYFPDADGRPASSSSSWWSWLLGVLPTLAPLIVKAARSSSETASSSSIASLSSIGGNMSTDSEGMVSEVLVGTPVAMAHRPNPWVRSIVTLGSPQKAVAPEKGRDMTGGALSWVHRRFPGAFFAKQGVSYTSVGGRTVRGFREPGEKSKGPRTPPQYAYDSYQQVCGDGQGIEGDAVVPLSCAFLGGATHIVLDGVWHSMSRIGTFEESDVDVVWYGSEAVVDEWLWTLVGPAAGQPISVPANVTGVVSS